MRCILGIFGNTLLGYLLYDLISKEAFIVMTTFNGGIALWSSYTLKRDYLNWITAICVYLTLFVKGILILKIQILLMSFLWSGVFIGISLRNKDQILFLITTFLALYSPDFWMSLNSAQPLIQETSFLILTGAKISVILTFYFLGRFSLTSFQATGILIAMIPALLSFRMSIHSLWFSIIDIMCLLGVTAFLRQKQTPDDKHAFFLNYTALALWGEIGFFGLREHIDWTFLPAFSILVPIAYLVWLNPVYKRDKYFPFMPGLIAIVFLMFQTIICSPQNLYSRSLSVLHSMNVASWLVLCGSLGIYSYIRYFNLIKNDDLKRIVPFIFGLFILDWVDGLSFLIQGSYFLLNGGKSSSYSRLVKSEYLYLLRITLNAIILYLMFYLFYRRSQRHILLGSYTALFGLTLMTFYQASSTFDRSDVSISLLATLIIGGIALIGSGIFLRKHPLPSS